MCPSSVENYASLKLKHTEVDFFWIPNQTGFRLLHKPPLSFSSARGCAVGWNRLKKVSNSILIWKHRNGPNVQPYCAQHLEMLRDC